MIVYIGRFPSEEYSASTLYEDYDQCALIEAELPDEEYKELRAAEQAYWGWQDKLQDLFERSTRSDKR